MKYLMQALSAELLKTRHTLGLWLCFLAPLALAFLELAMAYQYGNRFYKPGTNHWLTLFEHTLMMWSLLLLPMFVTLQMGLLGAVEHNNHTLKQLYALPVPRRVIFTAKGIIGFALIALSEMALLFLTVGVGLILRFTFPLLNFNGNIPWDHFIQCCLICFFASWMMIAIQFWVSMHWSSFVGSMGIGIVGTTAGVLMVGSKWAQYYPWVLSGVASLNVINHDPLGWELIIGLVGGILVFILSAWEVLRHDVL